MRNAAQGMRRFKMFRHDIPEGSQANEPDEVTFEGIEFSDGTVVLRCLTAIPSTSVWVSLADMMAVHGHGYPEYGAVLVWDDAGTPYICPKCNGQKHVQTPPWIAGDQETYSMGTTSNTYPCGVCAGLGYLVT
jgi:hypothetical protein